MDMMQHLKTHPFVLAPMAGVTDNAFRSLMKDLGAGIVITELVSAHGIKHQGEQTLKLLKFEKIQSPIGVQIFGEDAKMLAEAASMVEQMGFDFVDLNFGCPVKKIVKKGAGAAVLKDMNQLHHILHHVRSAMTIPLTIKIRTGWDEVSKNADQVCHIAYNEGVTWVTIHGRTRSQGYSGQADWEYIQQIKSQSPIPVIGNGDIVTPLQAIQRLQQSGCDGVMIGRGCLKRPWLIKEALKLYQNKPIPLHPNIIEVLHVLHRHLNNNLPSAKVLIQMKKFASWYSTGYKDSSMFRREVFQIKSKEELMNYCKKYFENVEDFTRQNDEHFMMGGHG